MHTLNGNNTIEKIHRIWSRFSGNFFFFKARQLVPQEGGDTLLRTVANRGQIITKTTQKLIKNLKPNENMVRHTLLREREPLFHLREPSAVVSDNRSNWPTPDTRREEADVR